MNDRDIYLGMGIISGLWGIQLVLFSVIFFYNMLRYEELVDPALGTGFLWIIFAGAGFLISILVFIAVKPLRLYKEGHTKPAIVLIAGIACYILPALIFILIIVIAVASSSSLPAGIFLAPYGFNCSFLGLILISLGFALIIGIKLMNLQVIMVYLLLGAMFFIFLIFFILVAMEGFLSTYTFITLLAIEAFMGALVNLNITVLSIIVLRLISKKALHS